MSRPPKSKPYMPNSVPGTHRAYNLFLGILLTCYGLAGLLTGRLSFDGRRMRIGVLEGGPALLMAAALLVGAAVFYSVIIDHFDTRDNERFYKAFRWGATRLGWCLVLSALIAHLYIGFAK